MSYDIGSTTTKKVDSENVGVAVGIFSLCALELEICLGKFYPPVAGKRRKKPLPGQGLNAARSGGAVSFPSGVWSEAPAEIEFGAFWPWRRFY